MNILSRIMQAILFDTKDVAEFVEMAEHARAELLVLRDAYHSLGDMHHTYVAQTNAQLATERDITAKAMDKIIEADKKLKAYRDGDGDVGLQMQYNMLLTQHQNLQSEFKDYKRRAPPRVTTGEEFTQTEIRALISLCHPDKHGGKESAQVMTAKLLDMKV